MRQIILIFILFSLSQPCISQVLPETSGEEIMLETDRHFYVTGERIYFVANYRFKYPIEDVLWSRLIYVELVRWNGEKIAQAKFKLHENSASGYLTIPGTLLSGNYYVRAYTRWMRNFPPEDYAYSLIKIINPLQSEIDPGPIEESGTKELQSAPPKGRAFKAVECFTDRSIYKTREKVELTIDLKDLDQYDSIFCLSVAKAAYIDTNKQFIQFPDHISPEEEFLSYLPEFRGISISGKILNADNPSSSANTTLHLSSPQNWEYFSTFQTREDGRFYFTLPDFYGQYDFSLDAYPENGGSIEILVDNDYCKRNAHLAYVPFSLDTLERRIALEMAVNMQISSSYREESDLPDPDSAKLPFYGSPGHVYYTGEYIQLPTLEEFIFELVKEVRTVRLKDQASLKLVAYSQHQNLAPLILLDNVVVFNVDELLKIPPDRIEKIEIIDEPYMLSGIKYSGLICLSSKRKDFAGITLNKNSLLFSYNLLSEGNFNKPDYGSINTDRLSYRNNLLFWNPDIALKRDNPQTLSFYTSDSKGEYIVFIRSINTRGKAQLYGTCRIMVE